MASLNQAMVACLLVILITGQKLVLVQEVFRHGARFPIYDISDDGSKYARDEKSAGELTTEGKNMHYLLGKAIYDQYWMKLFYDTPFQTQYNQSKFYIKSTDVNRTIESAQSHLMGLLQKLPILTITDKQAQFSSPQWPNVEATAGQVFPNAAMFHPVPVHTQKVGMNPYDKGDFLRTYSTQNCVNQKIWQQQNLKDPFIRQIFNNPRYMQALNQLSEATTKTAMSFQVAAGYYDNYYCSKFLGRPYLQIFQNQTFTKTLSIESIYTISMYINLFYTQKQLSATATGFFNATVHNIKNIISNPQGPQFIIYSAHDTTVGNMISALNLTNVRCIYQAFKLNRTTSNDTCISRYPYYTSQLIFEVYRHDNGSHYFKLKYNGENRKIPMCGWEYQCSVETLYQWYEGFKDENYLATCGFELDNSDSTSIQFTIIVILIAVILIMSIYLLTKYLKKKLSESTVMSGSNPKSMLTKADHMDLNEESNDNKIQV